MIIRKSFFIHFTLVVLIAFLLMAVFSLPVSKRLPRALAQCQVPATVTGVKVDYPDCSTSQCNFSQASCSWGTVAGATSYTVKITEVDTNTVISNKSVDPTTTKITFPVVQGRTYRCDVNAVNSCGAGGVGSDSLLCKVDSQLNPTATPSATVVPTFSPSVTTLPATGTTDSLFLMTLAAFVILGAGMLTFFLI